MSGKGINDSFVYNGKLILRYYINVLYVNERGVEFKYFDFSKNMIYAKQFL